MPAPHILCLHPGALTPGQRLHLKLRMRTAQVTLRLPDATCDEDDDGCPVQPMPPRLPPSAPAMPVPAVA